MRGYASIEPAQGPPKGAARFWISLALLAVTLMMIIPIYGSWFSGLLKQIHRFGLPILWGVLAFAAARRRRGGPGATFFLSLFGVSFGFALALIIGSRPIGWLGVSTHTPQGAAVDKIFAEVIPICAAIFLSAGLGRLNLEALGLRGGKTARSLGLGLLASAPMALLFLFDPSGGRDAVLATPPAVLAAWLPWIIIFSIANGFMEELWFRGLWLAAFKPVIGSAAALHVTSLAFWLGHVIVYWDDPTAIIMLSAVWLYMGYIYAVIRRSTGSLWGPALSHAIADFIFMLIVFSTARL